MKRHRLNQVKPRPLDPASIPKDVHAKVRDNFAVIERMWASGESYGAVSHYLKGQGVEIKAPELRHICATDFELRDRLNAQLSQRAAAFIEKAVDWADDCHATGEPSGMKAGIDTLIKIAERTDSRWVPKQKTELTGKDGGAIELKADMTLTPSEAYQRLASGKK